MAKRRKLQGRPLLIGSTTVAMVIGCGGVVDPPPPPGNLMAPPELTAELCIDTEPAGAKVVVHGVDTIEWTERCAEVTGLGGVSVTASAPGFEPSTTYQSLQQPKNDLKISLFASAEVPPPVGNLMPPQRIDATPPVKEK